MRQTLRVVTVLKRADQSRAARFELAWKMMLALTGGEKVKQSNTCHIAGADVIQSLGAEAKIKSCTERTIGGSYRPAIQANLATISEIEIEETEKMLGGQGG